MNFADFFFLFGSSFLIGLSGAMMPGPVLSMTIAETLKAKKRSWLVGVAVPSGHAILEIGLMVALWLGVSQLFQLPLFLFLVGIIGGTSLIVFGIMGLRTIGEADSKMQDILDDLGKNEDKPHSLADNRNASGGAWKSLKRPFLMGFSLSATSSGWWAWWASIGMGAITLANQAGGDVYIFSNFLLFVVFFLGHISSDYAWYMFIAGFVSMSKRKMNFKIYKVILICTNVFLIGMGIYFIFSSF